MVNIKHEVNRLWAQSRTMTATGFLMLAALVVFAAGMVLDPRTVTGAPAWLKPAKFAISTAIFLFTMAWLFRYIDIWRGFLRVLAAGISAIFILEVGIIAFQAARGVPSHFNAATTFDRVLFSIMGIAIFVLVLMTAGIFAALMRQRFADPAWGWWLRLGVLVTIIGSSAGGTMLRMTPEQLAAKRAGERIVAVGAHTVGAVDGGPGLPGTGWSTEHGDLRVAHFFGLHGMQVLPFIGWLVARRRYRMQAQIRLAFVTAASYVSLIGIVWWQALRGQSVVAPDGTTLIVIGGWLAATVTALFIARGGHTIHAAAAAGSGA